MIEDFFKHFYRFSSLSLERPLRIRIGAVEVDKARILALEIPESIAKVLIYLDKSFERGRTRVLSSFLQELM